jgi:hypothetical protein
LGCGVVAGMSFSNAPHFDLGFRLDGNKFAEVEQDTIDDVFNCVYASLITPEGFRPEAPDFGTPDLTFMTQPIDPTVILSKINADEPRAQLVLDEQPNAFDDLITQITIDVETGGSQ